jgi:hypothetical protein
MSKKSARDNDRNVELTLANTDAPPWRKEVVYPGVELRWIPEAPLAGEYLMKLQPASVVNPRTCLLDNQASVLWVGLPDECELQLRDDIRQWCEEHLRPLLSPNGRRVEVTIVLGPDLANVTGGLENMEAFTLPRRTSPEPCFHFLIGLNYPQANRTEEQESGWLRTALVHELEHVWQLLTLDNTGFAEPWLALAEMCAVYAERKHCQDEKTYLDFGSDFLRRLPCGLLNAHPEDGSAVRRVEPYWTFPFIEHLEQCAPGIYRAIWSYTVEHPEVLAHGPWFALDQYLKDRGSSLSEEWIGFCRSLFEPPFGSSIESIHSRFPTRLPTLRIDLSDSLPATVFSWQWRLWPLSVHWIHVRCAGGEPRILTWECPSSLLEENLNFHTSVRSGGGAWHIATGAIRLDPAQSSWDILLIDCVVPDLFAVFAAGRRPLFALDARQLCIQLRPETAYCHSSA